MTSTWRSSAIRRSADHTRRRLTDPEDEHSDLVYAADGDEVVASLRVMTTAAEAEERPVPNFTADNVRESC